MKLARIGTLILLASVLLSGCVFFKNKFDKSVDADCGSVSIKGIRDTVNIRRDSLGVPYIEAKNEDDMFFATGYVMANDRLYQMTAMKLVMQGRIAEFGGRDLLPMDRFIRTIAGPARVAKSYAALDAKSRGILESFAAGVNAYLSTHDNLPAEFVLAGYHPEPWKPEDTLYVFLYLNMDVSTNFIEELDYLIIANKIGYEKAAWTVPVYPDEELPFAEARKLDGVDPAGLVAYASGWPALRESIRSYTSMNIPASNNMALAPSRTRMKRSIIENDTHLMLTIPNAWMIVHQKCPGIDVAGVVIPGVPLVCAGYNGKIAWGVTMVMADTQDIFIEKMKSENGARYYEYKGQWLPVEKRVESFTDNKGRTSSITVESTMHGPLLNDQLAGMPFPPVLDVQPMPMKSQYGLALAWAVEGSDATVRGFYGLAKARTMGEAKEAISNVKAIYLNFIYGDRDNIAWQVAGAVPERKKGRGMLPSPGWTGEYDWQGFLPFTALPGKTNPPEGYLATANNRTVPASFQYVISSSWYYPDRADRMAMRLSAMKDATGDDITALQSDQYSLIAAKTQKMLHDGERSANVRAAIGRLSAAKKEKALEALAMLAPDRFNCVMAADSASAAVMGSLYYTFTRNTFMDEFPEGTVAWEAFTDMNMLSYASHEDHLVVRDESPFFENARTKEKTTKWDVVALSLADAIDYCAAKMGRDRSTWRWGRLHTYHWKHEISKATSLFNSYLNRGPYPAGGDSHTVNVTGFPWGRDFNTFLIPAMRFVCDFGKEEPAMLTLTHGQSGNPSNPHYGDMLQNFLSGKNHPLPFGEDAVRAQYRSLLELKPAR